MARLPQYIGKVYQCKCGNFLAPEQQWDFGGPVGKPTHSCPVCLKPYDDKQFQKIAIRRMI